MAVRRELTYESRVGRQSILPRHCWRGGLCGELVGGLTSAALKDFPAGRREGRTPEQEKPLGTFMDHGWCLRWDLLGNLCVTAFLRVGTGRLIGCV